MVDKIELNRRDIAVLYAIADGMRQFSEILDWAQGRIGAGITGIDGEQVVKSLRRMHGAGMVNLTMSIVGGLEIVEAASPTPRGINAAYATAARACHA